MFLVGECGACRIGIGLSTAKDFRVDYVKSDAVPDKAMSACLAGQHRAVNPHRQRLLVAAHKKTSAPPKEMIQDGHGKPAGKVKATAKAKGKAKGKAKAKAVAKPKAADPGQTKVVIRRVDTEYNIRRKQYLKTFLGLFRKCVVRQALLYQMHGTSSVPACAAEAPQVPAQG